MTTAKRTKRPSRKAPIMLVGADGKKVHPLVLLARGKTLKEIAKLLGHANHTTASIYISRARKKSTTAIPAEWVLPLANEMHVKPALLRPDLYLPEWSLN